MNGSNQGIPLPPDSELAKVRPLYTNAGNRLRLRNGVSSGLISVEATEAFKAAKQHFEDLCDQSCVGEVQIGLLTNLNTDSNVWATIGDWFGVERDKLLAVAEGEIDHRSLKCGPSGKARLCVYHSERWGQLLQLPGHEDESPATNSVASPLPWILLVLDEESLDNHKQTVLRALLASHRPLGWCVAVGDGGESSVLEQIVAESRKMLRQISSEVLENTSIKHILALPDMSLADVYLCSDRLNAYAALNWLSHVLRNALRSLRDTEGVHGQPAVEEASTQTEEPPGAKSGIPSKDDIEGFIQKRDNHVRRLREQLPERTRELHMRLADDVAWINRGERHHRDNRWQPDRLRIPGSTKPGNSNRKLFQMAEGEKISSDSLPSSGTLLRVKWRVARFIQRAYKEHVQVCTPEEEESGNLVDEIPMTPNQIFLRKPARLKLLTVKDEFPCWEESENLQKDFDAKWRGKRESISNKMDAEYSAFEMDTFTYGFRRALMKTRTPIMLLGMIAGLFSVVLGTTPDFSGIWAWFAGGISFLLLVFGVFLAYGDYKSEKAAHETQFASRARDHVRRLADQAFRKYHQELIGHTQYEHWELKQAWEASGEKAKPTSPVSEETHPSHSSKTRRSLDRETVAAEFNGILKKVESRRSKLARKHLRLVTKGIRGHERKKEREEKRGARERRREERKKEREARRRKREEQRELKREQRRKVGQQKAESGGVGNDEKSEGSDSSD